MQESPSGTGSYSESFNGSHEDSYEEDSGSDSNYTESGEVHSDNESQESYYPAQSMRPINTSSNVYTPQQTRQPTLPEVKPASSASMSMSASSAASAEDIIGHTNYDNAHHFRTSHAGYRGDMPAYPQPPAEDPSVAYFHPTLTEGTAYRGNKGLNSISSSSSLHPFAYTDARSYHPSKTMMASSSVGNYARSGNSSGYYPRYDSISSSNQPISRINESERATDAHYLGNSAGRGGDSLPIQSAKGKKNTGMKNLDFLPLMSHHRASSSLSSLQRSGVVEQFPSLRGHIDMQPDEPGQSIPKGFNIPNYHTATSIWEEEGTLCFVVVLHGMQVIRRCDNNMINGTKLLNSAKITRGRRDGVLKGERVRYVVKVGSMEFKGVWIPFERALDLAKRENVLDALYPLFLADLTPIIYSRQNFSRLRQLLAKGARRNPRFLDWYDGIPRDHQEPTEHKDSAKMVATEPSRYRGGSITFSHPKDHLEENSRLDSPIKYENSMDPGEQNNSQQQNREYYESEQFPLNDRYDNAAAAAYGVRPDRSRRLIQNVESYRQRRGSIRDEFIHYNLPDHMSGWQDNAYSQQTSASSNSSQTHQAYDDSMNSPRRG